MKTKQALFYVWTLWASLLLLWLWCGNASAQVLFYDNFQQFTNGTDLTATNYFPVSGPASASVITRIDNGSPTIVATNFLGNAWAFFDNSALTNKDDYRGYLSTVQSNQLLQITWKMWIQATNSGLGMFMFSVPVHDPQNPNVDYNPPLIFMDSGAIVAATNSAPGISTNGTFVITAPVIGNWTSLAGTVMTNQLILDYPDGTFSYSLNGQTLATLPLGPYFTNLVDSFTFTGFERAASSLGNRFAIGDVKVEATSVQRSSFQWAKRVASTINPDTELAIGMALDKQDNCYVTGWFDGTNDFGGVTLTNAGSGGQDIFVAKYNSVGALQWARRAGGSSTNWDVGRGLGVDTNGNVYVTGGFYGPADFDGTNLPATSGEEFFLAKYDNDGAIKWARSSTGGSGRVYGTGLAVDAAGNSYALATVDHLSSQATNITFGSTTVSIPANNGSPVMILVKYDDTGAVKWEQLMGGSGEVYATKVAVDATGNVYVRGTFFSTLTIGTSNLVVSAGSSRNMYLAKFDSSGGLKWIRHPVGGNVDEGGVAVDQAENVYVTGAFGGTPLNFGSITLTNVGTNIAHAFIAKYSSSGAIQWARQAGGTNGGMVNGNVFSGFYLDVALDGKGNPYAAGLLSPNTTSPSDSGAAVVAEYNPTGTVSWADAASGPPANPAASVVAKCALDSNGNCYLAGWYQGTATFGTNVLRPQGYWNYFLAKVAPPASPTLGIALTSSLPQLSVAGDIGSLFSLQRSPNLAGTNTPWQTLTTLSLTNRPQLYLDTSAPTGTNRFYRVGPPEL